MVVIAILMHRKTRQAKYWGGYSLYVVPPTNLSGGGTCPPHASGFGAYGLRSFATSAAGPAAAGAVSANHVTVNGHIKYVTIKIS